MILYHYTAKENLTSILSRGLLPSGMGIIYLTPNPAKIKGFGNVLLKIDTADLRLTAFDDCKDWEILCWGCIPPQNITLIGEYLWIGNVSLGFTNLSYIISIGDFAIDVTVGKDLNNAELLTSGFGAGILKPNQPLQMTPKAGAFEL